MPPSINPNTTGDDILRSLQNPSVGGEADLRHRARNSTDRKRRLQRAARRISGNYDTQLSIDPNHDTAHVDLSGYVPQVVISGREFPQPVTDYDEEDWDWLCQKALNMHESGGHIPYTHWDDFFRRVQKLPPAHQPVAKDLWNALEDCAIEKQIRWDYPKYSLILLHFRANMFHASTPGEEQPDGTYLVGVHQATVTAILDKGAYNSGTLDQLLDEDDNHLHFASEADRETFVEEVLPEVEAAIDDIFSLPGPLTRNKRIFEFIDTILPEIHNADESGEDEAGGGAGNMPNDAESPSGGAQKEANGLDGSEQSRGDESGESGESDDEGSGSKGEGGSGTGDGDSEGEGTGGDDEGTGSDSGSSADDGEEEESTSQDGDEAGVSTDEGGEEEDDEGGGGGAEGSEEDAPEDVDDTRSSGGGDGPEEDTAESDEGDSTEVGAGDQDGESDDGQGDSEEKGEMGQMPRSPPSRDDIETDEEVAESLRETRGPMEDEGDRTQAEALKAEAESMAKALDAAGGELMSDTIQLVDGQHTVDWETWLDAMSQKESLVQLLQSRGQSQGEMRTRRNLRRGRLDRNAIHRLQSGERRVKMKRDHPDRPEFNFVLALDRSSSMAGETIRTAERSLLRFALALEELGHNVMVMDLYAGRVRLAAPFGQPLEAFKANLANGATAGGTPLSDCLRIARERLIQEDGPGTENRMLVVTDGNPDNPSKYRDVLDECTFPVVGVNIRNRGQGAGEDFYHRSETVRADGDDIDKVLNNFARELLDVS